MIGRTRDRAAIERRAAIAHRSEHLVPHRILQTTPVTASSKRYGMLRLATVAQGTVGIVDQTALAKLNGMAHKRLDHRGFSLVLAG